MITRATARKHLRRLAFLPGGDDAERVDACLDTAQKHIEDEDELAEAVEVVKENSEFFPTPAKLCAALSMVRRSELVPEWQLKRDFDCPKCEDTGRVQTAEGLYPASKRCSRCNGVTASVATDGDLEI